MPYKDKKIDKEYHTNHYIQNKEKYVEARKRKRTRNRQYIIDIKKKSVCARCKNDDHRVLEFHHRDPKQKIEVIARLIRDTSIRKIQEEIDKCDILCANCHAIEHYQELE